MVLVTINVKKAICYQDDTKQRVQELRDSELADREEWFAQTFEHIFLTAPVLEMSGKLNKLMEQYDAWKLTA